MVVLGLISAAGCAITGNYHRGIMCKTCHEGKAEPGKPVLKEGDNPSLVCKECHAYNSDGDHHPKWKISGPLGDTATVAPEFKLVNGEMECLTCHRMHRDGRYTEGERFFLAGGPYADRRQICFRCHKKELYEKINPHNSMIDEEGKLEAQTCVVCHAEVPDPKVDRTRDVKFRASVAFLCWRCHPLMAQDFMDKHYLRKPSRDTFISMKWSEEDHEMILPLDFDARITCSTCHNPHQPGVMVDERAKKGAGEQKRLRAKDLCIKCHTSVK